MTIKTNQTVEHSVEIQVPSFWKKGNEYSAVLDNETAIVFYSNGLTTIMHDTPEGLRHQITSAFLSADACDESEWLDKYAEVLKSISLAPVMTVGKLQDERYEHLKNSINY